jgi:hypothetical protein
MTGFDADGFDPDSSRSPRWVWVCSVCDEFSEVGYRCTECGADIAGDATQVNLYDPGNRGLWKRLRGDGVDGVADGDSAEE